MVSSGSARVQRVPWIRSGLALVFAFASLGMTGCNKLKARDLLNKGVQAYKGGQYDQAIEHFKNSKELDPTLLNARLYLATAYASQYIPGAPSEENTRNGEMAVSEFRDVLKVDVNNLSAIDGIASMMYQMGGTPYDAKKFEESKAFHRKHTELRPSDPEPYYSIGVIDWTLAYAANKRMRAEYNVAARKQVKEEEPLPPALRTQFEAGYAALVDEGIQALQKATKLRSEYDDALAYLNLLYRQKADLSAAADERENYLKQADDLVDRVKAIKQKRLEAPAPATP